MKDTSRANRYFHFTRRLPPCCDQLWNPHFEGDAPIFQFRPADAKGRLILNGARMLKGPKMPDASKVMKRALSPETTDWAVQPGIAAASAHDALDNQLAGP